MMAWSGQKAEREPHRLDGQSWQMGETAPAFSLHLAFLMMATAVLGSSMLIGLLYLVQQRGSL